MDKFYKILFRLSLLLMSGKFNQILTKEIGILHGEGVYFKNSSSTAKFCGVLLIAIVKGRTYSRVPIFFKENTLKKEIREFRSQL